MASVITVKIKYDDNSKSYSEEFSCADTHPSPPIIADCEEQVRNKWTANGGQLRSTQIHTTVRKAK